MTDIENKTALTQEEMNTVAGGHPFEECFGDAALYRAGISYVNCIFGADEYWINNTRISKDLARSLRARSTELWNNRYADSADLVGFIREWKSILLNVYGIGWNGAVGTRSVSIG